IDIAADILDFSRIAIRIVAAACRRIIRHVPGRIEFLMQCFILRWMAMLRHCRGGYKSESQREICAYHAWFLSRELRLLRPSHYKWARPSASGMRCIG